MIGRLCRPTVYLRTANTPAGPTATLFIQKATRSVTENWLSLTKVVGARPRAPPSHGAENPHRVGGTRALKTEALPACGAVG